jgi:hypothetical protein
MTGRRRPPGPPEAAEEKPPPVLARPPAALLEKAWDELDAADHEQLDAWITGLIGELTGR